MMTTCTWLDEKGTDVITANTIETEVAAFLADNSHSFYRRTLR